MPYFDKHFTLEEANNLIPWVQDIFYQIHTLIEEGRDEKKIIPLFPSAETPTNGKLNGNGKHHKKRDPKEVMEQINKLIAELTDAGIVIQDVSRGLIDFPGYVDEDEVFLCYELDDGDTIQFWHKIDAGYAGRTPLDNETL